MAESWMRDTGDRVEQVSVVQTAGVEHRQEVVEDVAAARDEVLSKVTQLIGLAFFLLEALIGLRVALKLIAANPASPFAGLIYSLSDLFLWPFAGLTVTPAAGGMVLEISSLIAMLVYALVGWLLIRLVWLLFRWNANRMVSTYERDRRM